MGDSAALAEIANLAKTISTAELEGGRVQCTELQIENSKQLCEVLKRSNEERVFVFRGALGRRPSRLAKMFPPTEKPLQAVFLNFAKMNRIIEHVKSDQVISIETGIALSELNEYLSNHGQWLPVEYYYKEVSLADLIDTADGGSLEPFSGGIKHLVLGMELGIAQGESIKTGGKIVKNVTGYDLSKLFTGGRCWLAVPHVVHLRLHSKPETEVSFVVSSSKPHELIGLANRLQATGLPAFALEVIDRRLLEKTASAANVSPSIKADIEAFIASTGELDGKLIVSTRGHEEVAKEVAKALTEAVFKSDLGLNIAEVEIGLSNRIQRVCSDIFRNDDKHFEISLPASAMSYYFETQWQSGKPMWAARPSSGRLRMSVNDAERFLADIRDFSNLVNRDGSQPLTVAYANESHEYLTRRLLADEAANQGVKLVTERLKSKYDPNGILNPLVSFC